MAFTGISADGKTISYTDGKRWLWFSPFLSSGVLFFFGWLYFATGNNPLVTLLPLLYIFGFIPFLDAVVGEDPHNPPEEVVPDMSADPFYTYVAWLMLVPSLAVFIGSVWFVGTQELPWWSLIAITIAMGTLGASFIIIGHELGHKSDRANAWMAKFANGIVGIGHFRVAHNRAHHVKVATPEDCASARMGETIYAFMGREMFVALKEAWELESLRLRKKNLPAIHWQNEIIQSWSFTVVMTAGFIVWLGWGVLPYLVAHHFFAWYGLTQANYIEHYGLLRERLPNGKYEPCQPRHSWNTNHIVSNLLEIHLQRHSDHHANPMRPYQALRNFDDLPRLPSGYPGCIALAAVPPLWFKVMDPKVMDWAGGDLSKVNVCPKARKRLEARYGAGGDVSAAPAE